MQLEAFASDSPTVPSGERVVQVRLDCAGSGRGISAARLIAPSSELPVEERFYSRTALETSAA